MKNISASISARLKNISKGENKGFDFILTLYMIERLIYRLSISGFADNFILKGGLLLYLKLHNNFRPTKDIDLLAKNIKSDMQYVSNIFKEICNFKVEDDGLIFEAKTITFEKIKEEQEYEGVRIKITCFLGKIMKLIQLDIGFGDIIVPKSYTIDYPILLDMPQPKVSVYSLESVISEKFNAMVDLADTNSRMKDFYDISKLATSFNFDGRLLQKAICETFKRRKKEFRKNPIIFTDEFKNNSDKLIQWAAFLRRLPKSPKIDFESIIDLIIVFLKPVYLSVLNDKNFQKEWSFKKREWKNID
ncbi:MAG: nucleotidyl transferase AbiEii/AbiGii toxin family protein [Clostridiales bacterium]